MSTPKISFRVPTPSDGAEEEATGDVVTHDLSLAPGKDREREPLYGGDLANISEGMAVDAPVKGMSLSGRLDQLSHTLLPSGILCLWFYRWLVTACDADSSV